jgi:Ca2+-binding RTX toxin-like protein
LNGGSGNDRLVGGSLRDILRGGAGRDDLQGRGGYDALLGGSGGDDLDGGQGRDGVRGGAGRDAFVDSDAPAERVDFGHGDVLQRRLVLGSHAYLSLGTLFIIGTEAADAITVTQEPGAADADADDAILFIYSVRQGGRLIETASVPSQGVRRIRIESGGGDDVVDVTAAAGRPSGQPAVPVTVLAGHGNDEILGGPGNDNLNGGEGDDRIDGGGGSDRLGGILLGARDPLRPWILGEFPQEPGDDVIAGGAGDDAVAAGDDAVAAGAGNDRVSGGEGADRLWGGDDADEIRGDGGSDTFYTFDAPSEQLDRASGEPLDDHFDVSVALP